MLTEIHEHTCDLSLLPEKAVILDIGAFGMEFTNYFRNLGHTVHAVDIQEFEGEYDQIAITDYNGTTFIEQSEDLQATKIGYIYQEGKPQIPCCTLQTYMKIMDVEMFDLIKIDCEGSEYRIIMSLQKPPATQIILASEHNFKSCNTPSFVCSPSANAKQGLNVILLKSCEDASINIRFGNPSTFLSNSSRG